MFTVNNKDNWTTPMAVLTNDGHLSPKKRRTILAIVKRYIAYVLLSYQEIYI